MTKTSLDTEKLISLLEKMIDTRYMMLKELDFENHTYAHDYKKKHYDPLKEELRTLLEPFQNINKN